MNLGVLAIVVKIGNILSYIVAISGLQEPATLIITIYILFFTIFRLCFKEAFTSVSLFFKTLLWGCKLRFTPMFILVWLPNKLLILEPTRTKTGISGMILLNSLGIMCGNYFPALGCVCFFLLYLAWESALFSIAFKRSTKFNAFVVIFFWQ